MTRVRTGLFLVLAPQFALGLIRIDIPKGGWRNGNNKNVEFTQKVQYPASVVNLSETESTNAMIRGRILGKPKSAERGDPYTLIVNGIAMPLAIRENGFARPYVFGPGSNSVEIQSPDGKDRARTQFFEANPNAIHPKLSVVLSWDTDQTDLDLHVVSPDGKHCWYGDRVIDNGGALDIDVTTGYGPEIYSTTTPVKGTYLVYVNYYGSGPRDDLTVTQVTVVQNQNSPDEKKETFTVPMRKAGEVTLVHSFVVP